MRIVLNRALVALSLSLAPAAAAPPPQETAEKRLAAIVGVAVEEYGKAIDANGRLLSALELDEASSFLADAREVAKRVASPTALLTRALVDSLANGVRLRIPPAELAQLHQRFTRALGTAGALDLPSRVLDARNGARLYAMHCGACHGSTGAGDGPAARGLNPTPPAIGHADVMAGVSPALQYRIISVGVQGTAMAGFAATLTPDERWDVIGHVATLRGEDPAQLIAAARSTAANEQAMVAATPSASAPRDAARAVVRLLDDALARAREGRAAEAGDLAFDAYLAFEPLEGPARARDPNLVAAMERHFGEFKGAARAGDLRAAAEARDRIERGMPSILELTETAASGWGAFFESFLIILREGFEAILVIGAIVAFLVKTGNRHRLRDVWFGVGAGLVASAALAVVLSTVLKAVPAGREIIEGGTMLVAVAVLFSISYWLLSKVEAAKWQRFIKEKVGAALSHGGSFALAITAFLAVFREGAETALFYQVLYSRPGTGTPVTGGMFAGFAALAVIFTLFYRFGIRLPLRPFFAVTSGLLYYMAFVFMGKGLRELQEGNAIPITPVPGVPHIDALGIFPTVETLLGQGVLVALLLWALWKTLTPEVAEEVEAPVIPPEVAARLAELQATATRLQDRVDELQAEIHEHEADATAHDHPVPRTPRV
ncbi:MAG: cytochrome c/FTR1 family iron permease [Gemmatimonadaceae bacterium]|nr:cytochrome c/FTR1 family iron permease [Gemmatimonadaceae bacterium]